MLNWFSDLVAIPDFVSGAMEHWGLVTFRETALLYNPTESSTANQKRVATVVAHELAHQWFGNLSKLNAGTTKSVKVYINSILSILF